MRKRTLAMAIAALAVISMPALAGDEQTLDAQAQRMDSASSPGQTAVSGKIAADFSDFAGSTQNADSLAQGLRNGTPITLTGASSSETVVFDPPTKPMGNGNVFISMSLAKQQLANYGITDPTPSELQAAMVGGTITAANGQTVQLQGVLTMRADGMGWGQIAHSMGTKLGPVISGIKAANRSLPSSASTTTIHAGSAGAGSMGKSGSRITTAAGTTASGSAQGYHGSGRGSGIVTATGAPVGGYGGGYGAGGSHGGIVTAGGATAGAQGHANAGLGHGKGL